MAKVIDNKGRVGIIDQVRGPKESCIGIDKTTGKIITYEVDDAPGLFAHPENVAYEIDAEAIIGVPKARLLTTTWWSLNPDGSYWGQWYDETDNFHSARVSIEPLTCKRCGHSWTPRILISPKNCPHCNSPCWNKPKV